MPLDDGQLPNKWVPLVKRLSGVASRECSQRGFALMSIDILVSPHGEPVFWGEPRLNRLEPRLGAYEFLNEILRMMGERVIAPE